MNIKPDLLHPREIEFIERLLAPERTVDTDRFFAADVPEKVRVAADRARLQVAVGAVEPAYKHRSAVGNENVVCQCAFAPDSAFTERLLFDPYKILAPAYCNLALFAERENIIAHDILAAEMQVIGLAVDIVADIVFYHDMRRALVAVYSPAAVIALFDIIDDIAAHRGAGLHAQHVYAAHIGENALAQVVDKVFLDTVIAAYGIAVAPYPPDRHGAVEHVVDMIMHNFVCIGIEQRNSHGTEKNMAGVVDMVIGNFCIA